MSVFQLKAGQSATVIGINAAGSTAERLKSLGITVGKKVTALSFSLFNSSVLIGCGAIRLGLRKNLADKIEVQPC